MTLRHKLVVFLLAALFVPLAVAGVAGYLRAEAVLEEVRLGQLESLSLLKVNRIEQLVDQWARDLEAFVNRHVVRQGIDAMLSGETTPPETLLDAVSLASSLYDFLNISFYDGQGALVFAASPEKEQRLHDQAIAPILAEVLGAGASTFSLSRAFALPGQPGTLSMLMARPMSLPSGAVVTVVVHSTLDELLELMADYTGLGTTGESLIGMGVDGGVLFVTPLRHVSAAPLTFFTSNAETSALPMKRALAGHSGAGISLDYRGKEVIAAWHPLPRVGWGLVAKIDHDEAFSLASDLRIGILVISFLIWSIASIVVVMLIRRLTGTINVLQTGAERIGSGDLDFRFAMTGKDELARLGEVFDSMTESLQRITASRDELDAEIRIREETERALKANEREMASLISELEGKNAELERFTYTVSHDLKSPLITIKGFLGYLVKDLESGDRARLDRDIDRIASAATKMAGLLEDLLELSRIGRVVSPDEVVSIDELVDEVRVLLAGRIEERGVVIDVEAGLPALRGDRARLLEVFQNLVDNAIKFSTADDAAHVEIGARPSDGATLFFIRDHGIGLEANHTERIFGLFDKLDKRSEGTGVGLALVRRIVELHGGRIWAESAGLGCGTTMVFELPLAKEVDDGTV